MRQFSIKEQHHGKSKLRFVSFQVLYGLEGRNMLTYTFVQEWLNSEQRVSWTKWKELVEKGNVTIWFRELVTTVIGYRYLQE